MVKLLNPWVILGIVLLLLAAAAGGAKLGSDHQIAKQAKTEALIAAVEKRAQIGAATAIAENKPVHQFNKQVIERETRIVPDYSRCVHSDAGLRALNSALENTRAESVGDSVLPDADAPGR